jgi:pilus assembly protein Flp/PilA
MESIMDMLKTLSQALFVRLFTQLPGRARNQRGASALEYIVLAAVIVLAVSAGALLLTSGGNPIETTFQDIADALPGGAAEPSE